MKSHLLKSILISVITAVVATTTIGESLPFIFFKSSPNIGSVYAGQKSSLNISDIAIISKEITVKILGASNPGSGVIVNKKMIVILC